jgi:hypothetical protein
VADPTDAEIDAAIPLLFRGLTYRVRPGESFDVAALAERRKVIRAAWSVLSASAVSALTAARDEAEADEFDHCLRRIAVEEEANDLRSRLLAAEQRAARLAEMLRDPNGLKVQRERFITEVPPQIMCDCGHRAELHDVRLNALTEYERYCTACSCDAFDYESVASSGRPTGP